MPGPAQTEPPGNRRVRPTGSIPNIYPQKKMERKKKMGVPGAYTSSRVKKKSSDVCGIREPKGATLVCSPLIRCLSDFHANLFLGFPEPILVVLPSSNLAASYPPYEIYLGRYQKVPFGEDIHHTKPFHHVDTAVRFKYWKFSW